jgi:hypothetical protein
MNLPPRKDIILPAQQEYPAPAAESPAKPRLRRHFRARQQDQNQQQEGTQLGTGRFLVILYLASLR